MLPYFTERFGNAASQSHAAGHQAASAVERARDQIAELIGAKQADLIFTSGATESDNIALRGVADILSGPGHIITVATEHKAVLDTARHLEALGHDVTYLAVDAQGSIDPEALEGTIRDDTALISLMAANNEIGTLHPMASIGAIARRHGALFHCDAAQGAGKVDIDVEEMQIDLLSLSAHKMYGPKGVGALYVRRRPPVRLSPQIHGGGHERGLRSGTLNVPGIVGFGTAAALARASSRDESPRLSRLAHLLFELLTEELEGVALNGHPSARLPGNLNVSFAGVESDALMARLPDIAVSSGSACTSATPEPSYVLRAIGLSDELAYGSIRFGVGRFTTEEEVRTAAARVIEEVAALRGLLQTTPTSWDRP
jgi:cysteine desulfurase